MEYSATTSLPFYLHLEDGDYEFAYKGNNVKLTTKKQVIQPSRRIQECKGLYFLRDRWGMDEYTEIQFETNKVLKDENEAKEFVVEVANYMINIYKYHAHAIHVINIITEDLYEFRFIPPVGHKVISLEFSGGLRSIDSNELSEISNNVRQILKYSIEPTLYDSLLFNAEHFIFTGEYRLSLLESVVALEVVVSSVVRHICTQKNIPKVDINEYIRQIGITGIMKTTLKLILPAGQQPDEILLNKCKGSITLRNKIMHEGRQGITRQNAEEAFDSVKQFIKKWDTILSQTEIRLH